MQRKLQYGNLPKDKTIEIFEEGFLSAFYDSGYWWYVRVDEFLGECYSVGPEPTMWREIESPASCCCNSV